MVDLPELLEPGDLLVVNNTRVLPARLPLRRASGGPPRCCCSKPATRHLGGPRAPVEEAGRGARCSPARACRWRSATTWGRAVASSALIPAIARCSTCCTRSVFPRCRPTSSPRSPIRSGTRPCSPTVRCRRRRPLPACI
ncbi:MAG: S-adenosylmethionine:tRNA ribosyltransferase-isomerase [Acidimicrobiales bacterium]